MPKFNGFSGNYTGLSDEEVRRLQAQYGKNILTPEKRRTFLREILSNFREPMFLLLFITGLLYFLLGKPRDGTIMFCFVVFIFGINFFQQWRTDKTLEALKDLSSPRVKVIRNGRSFELDSRELTVGDLIILSEGEKIAADGQILELFDLGVDESTLTGESEVVWKEAYPAGGEKDAHWRRDYCYAGTVVTQGSAIVRVTAIGLNTEYGKIGRDVLAVPQQPTPLERQTRHLIKVCALIGLALFGLVFLITLRHTRQLIDSILSGLTLAMAMIPEEFPVILTVFLAMGSWRLARKNSLIRRMPTVETLGAVSVLCVDKTGTLTRNQMRVQALYGFHQLTEREVLYWAGLGCEKEPYDPMERAILDAAAAEGINRTELFAGTLLHEYPFTPETKMMGHVWGIAGKQVLAAKGSPESILPLCALNETELKEIGSHQESMAGQGFRVIAVARRLELDTIPGSLKDNPLELVGLVGLADPPREAVPGAIRVCNQAGIRVVMITGDNGTTARSMARQIGMAGSDAVITGRELDKLSDEELKNRLKTTNIFARVIPAHKMRIVKALKEIGETVAMTGDGVNDAPALKLADIGIAMGKRGTGVAREAADMILLDDNFTTIVDTIRDGRRIYDNIRKAIGYVFVIHIPIALIALLAPLLHLPLMLLPIHVVLLELMIDPTCSVIFERQPAEADIMRRKPRSPKAPLVTASLMTKSVLQGMAICAAAFGAYTCLLNQGWEVAVSRTFALVILGLANMLLVYVNRSDREFTLMDMIVWKDRLTGYVNLCVLAILALLIYLPAANHVAKTLPLPLPLLLGAVALAAVSTLWWELVKLRYRRLN